jgi:putative DNA methylase
MNYPKRLIEVDLPIARISAHARREKSIRHGHISTLHIWWARRPLAACRAVICAALWPDPADPLCPQDFRDEAAAIITAFADKVVGKSKISGTKLLDTCSAESIARWEAIVNSGIALDPKDEAHQNVLRFALLDFIADFANWDNSTVPAYLETARVLTQAAHEALGGAPGTRPLVVDPFAGGGSIPLEALRVGAGAFASDLNPVPVLLNKVVLEYIPKYGQRLADEVRKWGEWIKKEAEKELAEFYPKDPDGATPIAYLWARTIQCEGPSCGATIPLMRSLWLAKKPSRSVALQLVPNRKAKRVDFQIVVKQRGGWVNQDDTKTKIEAPKFDGTVKRGSATCPCCGYTTPVAQVREQFRARHGGADDTQLVCVISTRDTEQGRFYRLPSKLDSLAAKQAALALVLRKKEHKGPLSLVPDEPLPPQGTLGFRVQLYGMLEWGNLFSARQALAITTFVRLVNEVGAKLSSDDKSDFRVALQSCLALAVDRLADKNASLTVWNSVGEKIEHVFGRQALPIAWDFPEVGIFSNSTGNWMSHVDLVSKGLSAEGYTHTQGHSQQCSATKHPLPDDSASTFITDPPYYDAVPYADLSDFFYVWLRRMIPEFGKLDSLTPKVGECIVDNVRGKSSVLYESTMKEAMAEGRRVLSPSGIGIVVFAHKSTAGWEKQLQAMIDAGWIMTGSWPIDTERPGRLRAQDSAALASSVHIVCRPRENPDGTMRTDDIGDWRDVLSELPCRIHQWMPRLAEEGVVGADAIFACLGPALEIFSRYSRVEKASGEVATLREYLEHVWAAVSTEALSMIFHDADAAGLEPDARLTAMWLWTLGGGSGNGNGKPQKTTTEDTDVEDEDSPHPDPLPEGEGTARSSAALAVKAGFVLEYDAARKIAQGLGVHLEKSESIVEVKGDKARLLPVGERTEHLFGKTARAANQAGARRRRKPKQKTFFEEFDEVEASEAGWGELKGPPPGSTVLDRLHQAMIMFAAGRGELLKRFLVEEGIGKDARFWKLAQSLSALYPRHSDEKRWVDGVLGRKKGLGV